MDNAIWEEHDSLFGVEKYGNTHISSNRVPHSSFLSLSGLCSVHRTKQPVLAKRPFTSQAKPKF